MQSQVIEGFQLSPQQKRLWPEQQASPWLRTQCLLRLEGPLDPEALARALQRLVERYEILRTGFEVLPGMDTGIQVLAEGAAASCDELDLSGLSAAEREQRAQAAFDEEAGNPFDLARPPLARFRLLRFDAALHLLLISLPALCADSSSLSTFCRELARSYQDGEGGEPEEEPLQYIEFSEWRHSLLEEPEAEKGLELWRRQRLEEVAPLRLPLEAVPEGEEPAPASIPVAVGERLSERLEELARAWECPPSAVWLAVWQGFLGRITGRGDVPVEMRFDGRKYPELQGAFGLFEEYLPLVARLGDDPCLARLADRSARAAMEAHTWQEYFPAPERPEGTPPVLLDCEELPEDPEPSSLRFTVERRFCCTGRFRLRLSCLRQRGGWHASLDYDPSRHAADAAAVLAGQLSAFLSDALERPEAPLPELSLLSPAERQAVLVDWNSSCAESAAEATVDRLFERQAARTPEAVAVACGGRRLTYAELDRQANRLGRRLRAWGVRPGDLVVLCLPRSVEMIVGLLGILKCGAAYVPLDAGQPRVRLEHMLADAGASLVLTESSLASAFEGTALPRLLLDAEQPALAGESSESLGLDLPPDGLAYVIFTSGSTGQPKGTMIAHRSVVNLAATLGRRVYAGLPAPLRVSVNAPLAFDASVKQVVQLLAGHELHILPEEARRDGEELLALLVRERIEVLDGTPAQLRLLLGAGLAPEACPDLRLVLVGGEAVDAALWRSLAALDGIRFVNVYGPTECTVDTTACEIGGEAGRPALGRPLDNVRVFLLDPGLQPVPTGVPGELCVAGAGLARGYAHRPETTAERFVPDPFAADWGAPGSRLYRTGDLARHLPGGILEYLGRIDHQVKVRGFRIELGEIEAVLAEAPGIREAAVVAWAEPSAVPGEQRLVAYAAPAAGADADADGLRAFLRERLPDYMLPGAFVLLDALPLTRNGKVDRAALPPPGEAAAGRETGRERPRNQVEELLAEIWADLLGYERVGIEASFFELGGHSLLATQLIARVRQALQVEIPLRSLFDAPTVAGLARAVEAALRAERGLAAPPLVPVPRDRPLPLSFQQRRLWFLDRLLPGNPFYNTPLRTRLSGALDLAALARVLTEIVARHEVLRTRFVEQGDEPVQQIDSPVPVPLPLIDLQALPEAAREEEMQRLGREEAARPFDLAHGPLLRSSLVRLGGEEHAALMTLHHIVTDGWSMGLLIEELGTLYDAFHRGQSSPLPGLPLQYADYAAWQRSWLQGEALRQRVESWRRYLEGAPPVLELPTDRPRPAEARYRGARRRTAISPAVTEALHQLCRRERVSLFMALLSAFAALLSRTSGQTDLCVGSPVAGRASQETERLIGFFVNMLVLRINASGSPGVRELVVRTREIALEAHAHQDVPFETLVDELQPERSLNHSPLFQVMLVLQNMPHEERKLPGLALQAVGVDAETSKCDLTLTLEERQDHVVGTLEYDLDLFDGSTADRMLGHLGRLLEGMLAHPERSFREVPLLDGSELQQVVLEWNDTALPRPAEGGLHTLVEAQVDRTPEGLAVSFEHQAWTYRELDEAANQLARWLARQGVRTGDLVGVWMERSVEMVVALLGTIKAGAAYLPLDPGYPRGRLLAMLDDAGAKVVLTQEHLASDVPATSARVICLDSEWYEIAVELPERPGWRAAPDDLAYVIYTSGSTGEPKGVMNTHRAICNRLLWMQEAYGLTSADRVLQKTPFSFDVSVWEFFWPLLTGAALVVARPEGHREPAYLAHAIEAQRITTVHFIPSMLQLFLEEPGLESRCASLRRVICSGEALPFPLAEAFHARLGAELHNLYGPTEAAVDVTFWACERRPSRRVVPIGRPIANTRIHLVDGGFGPVPAGIPGELCIAGVALARGYRWQAALTAERFVPDPFAGEPGARMYRTGDLARHLADGAVEFLGRRDQQVKLRGIRIELEEIESVLARCPGVCEAAVAVRGEREAAKLVAYLVCDPGQEPAAGELRERLSESLPQHAVPTAFLRLKGLPRTTSGKLDRASLPDPGSAETVERSYLAPRYFLELQLCQIWEELLRVERVGVRDSFFDIGGSSFLAVRLQKLIERAFGYWLDLPVLFRAPTVEQLAGILRRRISSQAPSALVELQQGGAARPLFLVHPAGGDVLPYAHLARQLAGERPVYGLRVRALYDRTSPHRRIEDMAAEYAAAVQSVDPAGPYLLGGWSLGGVVAFEMARQLRAAGRKVALLAMIDSQAPDPARRPPLSDLDLLRAFADGLGVREIGGKAGDVKSALTSILVQARASDVLPADFELAELERYFEILRANSQALAGYRPGSYDGSAVIFRAAERADAADLTRGWERLVQGGVSAQETPGSHHDLLLEPNVRQLSERLRACCAAAEAEGA